MLMKKSVRILKQASQLKSLTIFLLRLLLIPTFGILLLVLWEIIFKTCPQQYQLLKFTVDSYINTHLNMQI